MVWCAVLWWRKGEKNLPFIPLFGLNLLDIKTHERLKHTTQQSVSAGVNHVLNVSPLYTKYSGSWNSICSPTITSSPRLSQLMKISVCERDYNLLTLLAAAIQRVDANDSYHWIGIILLPASKQWIELALTSSKAWQLWIDLFLPCTVPQLRLCI